MDMDDQCKTTVLQIWMYILRYLNLTIIFSNEFHSFQLKYFQYAFLFIDYNIFDNIFNVKRLY